MKIIKHLIGKIKLFVVCTVLVPISIVNTLGLTVVHKQLNDQSPKQVSIDVSLPDKGIYFINLQSQDVLAFQGKWLRLRGNSAF